MRYGAIINGILIITGGLLGLLFGRFIKERVKDTVLKGIGVSVMLMGVAGTLSKMFLVTDGAVGTQGSVMLVVCLAAGAVIGELLDIDGGMERFGRWLKIKTGNAREGGFVDAFVTTTLIVGVGAMAIMGSITDGLTGDPTILVIKSIIDLITVAFLSSAMGKGCLFSFIPVLVFEGAVTVLAGFLPHRAQRARHVPQEKQLLCVVFQKSGLHGRGLSPLLRVVLQPREYQRKSRLREILVRRKLLHGHDEQQRRLRQHLFPDAETAL